MKSKKIRNLSLCLLATLSIACASTSQASAAWKRDTVGWWNTEGNSYSIGWRLINGSWYHFSSSGYMSTGWVNDNGTWYYMDKQSGAMKTGWINDNNTWYYLNSSGAMQTGFLTLNDKTYYLNTSGAMYVGDITIDGVKYTFAQSGEKVTSTNTNNNVINNNNTTTDTSSSESSTSSGGSGGSGGGSPSTSVNKKLSINSTYSDLYGVWKVKEHINSNMKPGIDESIIPLAIGERFTISSSKIFSLITTIESPIVEENVITSEEFSEIWDDTLSNLGISGDKVKCIKISEKNNSTHYAHLIITEDGKVYIIGKNVVFLLTKVS